MSVPRRRRRGRSSSGRYSQGDNDVGDDDTESTVKATSVAFFGAISNGLGQLVNFLSHMHWHHVNYIFKSIVLKVGQTITTHLACHVLA